LELQLPQLALLLAASALPHRVVTMASAVKTIPMAVLL